MHSRNALIIEDIREAEIVLKSQGYECDRITHNELLSSAGTEYTGKLLRGDYSMLWISTPDDWYIRAKKASSHWQRILQWIQKALILGILLVLFGPPGFFWKIQNLKETIQESKMTTQRMRLCHFGDQFNIKSTPSGSYMQLATTVKLPMKMWQCKCKIPFENHTLDWYGRDQPHAEWRKRISSKFVKEVCNALLAKAELRGNAHSHTHAILDGMIPPLPITDIASNTASKNNDTESPSISLPTDARIRQKERLAKLKEAGLKPKKKVKYTEPGNDDCGDDISGLGPDAVLLSLDVIGETIDSSDDDEDLFLSIPTTIRDSTTNVYSAISHLCYGKYNQVDLLELCGGAGRISQVAFRRGLTSGGNLDLTTGCDIGDPTIQKAILHYLDTCYVMVVVLQPNCRSVGRNSF